MLIALLAWFPLSLPIAVLVGKCIKLGSGEADSLVAAKHGIGRRPQKFLREQASA